MKKIILTLSVLAVSVFATSAEELFDAKCSMCHIKTMPKDKSSLIAPPLMGVMRHVKMQYPFKDEAVEFIVDYAMNPTKNKAVCMPEKFKRFCLMPSQKDNVTKDELYSISAWMYDNYPPKDFKGGRRSRP
jgi:cytochrome c